MDAGAILAVVGLAILTLLAALGYVNNLLSLKDRIDRRLGRVPEPLIIDEIRRLLEEFSERATLEGAADAGTDALAAAATADTADHLREAIELQRAHREREAIDVLYEAFRRDLEPLARTQLHLLLGGSFPERERASCSSYVGCCR